MKHVAMLLIAVASGVNLFVWYQAPDAGIGWALTASNILLGAALVTLAADHPT